MNQIMRNFTNFLWQLDNKSFNRLLMGIIGGIVLIFSILLYMQFNAIKRFKREMTNINNQRMQTKELLEKNELVKKQRKQAEEIFAQDKKFKLKETVEEIVAKLKLEPNLKAYPLTRNDLEYLRSEGYEEVQIEAEFINLNMKQLVDLLQEFAQNNRIVTKRLVITKSKKQPAIDVQLTISTLLHKTTASEQFETEEG